MERPPLDDATGWSQGRSRARSHARSHSRGQWLQASVARLVGSRLFWALFVGVLFAFPIGRSLARSLPPAPPVLGEVGRFTLTDQYGNAIGSAELVGHLWVATLLPSEAASPEQAAAVETMRTLIHRTKNLGPTFRMITIAADPVRDSQARRRELVEKYCSSSQLWSFLGGSEEEVGAAKRAITQAVGSGPADSLYLVDMHGRLRGVYGRDKSSLDRLMQDISYVANLP
jgi:cytochrome oxidase Cu insertion factor (SCO1/SenC/PrrC family)